jgi:hypothetical protein
MAKAIRLDLCLAAATEYLSAEVKALETEEVKEQKKAVTTGLERAMVLAYQLEPVLVQASVHSWAEEWVCSSV